MPKLSTVSSLSSPSTQFLYHQHYYAPSLLSALEPQEITHEKSGSPKEQDIELLVATQLSYSKRKERGEKKTKGKESKGNWLWTDLWKPSHYFMWQAMRFIPPFQEAWGSKTPKPTLKLTVTTKAPFVFCGPNQTNQQLHHYISESPRHS